MWVIGEDSLNELVVLGEKARPEEETLLGREWWHLQRCMHADDGSLRRVGSVGIPLCAGLKQERICQLNSFNAVVLRCTYEACISRAGRHGEGEEGRCWSHCSDLGSKTDTMSECDGRKDVEGCTRVGC